MVNGRMCGITGIYSLNGEPIFPEEISAQIDTVVHRGPNQGAVFVSPRHSCGMGIRRLSIIDVTGGNQPLSNEDGSIHLVYNGETYNYRAIRQELEALGHRPKTYSDAEVVLHGYEAWGPQGILQKMRGMVAFSLWDENQQQLFVARDRFGIKPLYYAEHQGRLYYASEIKAILSQSHFRREVNPAAIEAMFTLGFVPGPYTMFKGIYKLPPAHYLLAHNGAFRIEKYWELNFDEPERISGNEAAERFLALLSEAVQMRLMSEVPVGALLSGGLDSGTLVALIRAGLAQTRQATNAGDGTLGQAFAHGSFVPVGRPSRFAPTRSTIDNVGFVGRYNPPLSAGIESSRLKTVSIGFEQSDYDESSLARELAQFIGTDHVAVTLTSADFDDYPAIMHHLEEPQCSATAVPIFKLYQTCRRAGLTVVLTGEGADELLGGYHWHRGDALVRPLLALPEPVRRFIANSPLPMSAAARRVLARGATEISSRYRDWLEVGGQGFRRKLLAPALTRALSRDNGEAIWYRWADKLVSCQTAAALHQTLWLEAQTRLVDFINFEVDKLSMAHSIEARVPFLDHKLWEFCAALPAHYKLKGRTEKYLLRQATQNLLPEATRTRSKKGLAAPYAVWLKAKRLPEWAESNLSAAALQHTGLFNPDQVQRLRHAHQAGQPDLGPLLMGVLSTQVWYHHFVRAR